MFLIPFLHIQPLNHHFSSRQLAFFDRLNSKCFLQVFFFHFPTHFSSASTCVRSIFVSSPAPSFLRALVFCFSQLRFNLRYLKSLLILALPFHVFLSRPGPITNSHVPQSTVESTRDHVQLFLNSHVLTSPRQNSALVSIVTALQSVTR